MIELKLAPHVHTQASDDSDWSLQRLAGVLRSAGFDGALVCDHDRTLDDEGWRALQEACDRVGNERRFVLVPGVEYQDADHVIHLPVFGAGPFYGRFPQIAGVIAASREDGAAAVLAHPARRDAWRRFDPEWAPHLAAIEVWNRKYDGVRPNAWALDAARRHGIPASVALDWHGPRQLYPLALHTEVPGGGTNSDHAASVVAALREGRVRATAYGIQVERFGGGAIGAASRGMERVRRSLAPGIRRLERLARGRA